jgi:nitroreductase
MTDKPHVPERTMRRIVELATRAPSVHNTQPWRWRADRCTLELHADRRYQLQEADPTGRDLLIACGAALHQAELAAGALGWPARTDRFPEPSDPDLLARLDLAAGEPPAGAEEVIRAIELRCTDRRRFTSWPVPDERLAHLAQIASERGTRAAALTDPSDRFHAERLILRAAAQQQLPAVETEQEQWRDRSRVDGVPSAVVPSGGPSRSGYPQRFTGGDLEDMGELAVQGSDGLLVLFDIEDEPAAWLRAGEGLSALWLAATTSGLSIVPLSQVVEIPETRRALQYKVLGGLAYPLVLARVGWQPIGRSDLARTPRRPVSDVLTIVGD